MALLLKQQSHSVASASAPDAVLPVFHEAGQMVLLFPRSISFIEDCQGLLSSTPDVPQGSVKLVSISFSHYCEKARWCLDLSPLATTYIEDAHPPVLHCTAAVRITKNPRKSATPLLVFPTGQYIQDSTEILLSLVQRHPNELQYLYPPDLRDKVLVMEHEFDEQLGVKSRQIAYYYFLGSNLDKIAPYLGRHAPKVEAYFAPRLLSRIGPLMLTNLGVTERTHAESLQAIRAVFQRISVMLQEAAGGDTSASQSYIFGTDKMTAADLTFAALTYPLIAPPETADLLPPLEERHPDFKKLTEELRATPAGQLVLRMYREDRYPGQLGAVVKLRTTKRDRVPWSLLLGASVMVAAVTLFAVSCRRSRSRHA